MILTACLPCENPFATWLTLWSSSDKPQYLVCAHTHTHSVFTEKSPELLFLLLSHLNEEFNCINLVVLHRSIQCSGAHQSLPIDVRTSIKKHPEHKKKQTLRNTLW